MDRSWMKKSRWEIAYEDGVEEFLAFAYWNLPHDSEILCACKKCNNRITQSRDEVRIHLRCDGILQGYTTWVHHGENYDRPSIAFVDEPNITTLPASGIVQGCQDGESDSMQELLHAAFGRAAGLPQGEADDFQSGFAGMEHNAPEDLVNPARGDDLGRDQNIYERFFKDAHIRLYPGCKYSRLSFLVHLYHLKCLNGWSQESFGALLGLLSSTLPPEANLPK
uniref:Transposase-associated domain-containing protein n=1 Tax=Setaria italica TaxID=4555 RepID=K4A171_SETIT